MIAVAEATQTVDSVRVAVLAAMAIPTNPFAPAGLRPPGRRVPRARAAVPDHSGTGAEADGVEDSSSSLGGLAGGGRQTYNNATG